MEKKGKSKFFRIVDRVEEISLVVMFMIMVISIFLQVIMRYVFKNSLTWSEELGKFIFVWISWLGLSIGERNNEHIKLTLVVDKLSPKWQKIFEIIAYIILLIILVVTLAYAVQLVGFQKNVNYTGIKISTSWGYLSLVLGCGFMSLRVIGVIYRDIVALVKKDYTLPSHPHAVDQITEAVEAYSDEGGAN